MGKFIPKIELDEDDKKVNNAIYVACYSFVQAFRKRRSPWDMEDYGEVRDNFNFNRAKKDVTSFAKYLLKHTAGVLSTDMNYGNYGENGPNKQFINIEFAVNYLKDEFKKHIVKRIKIYVPHGSGYLRYGDTADDMITKDEFEEDKSKYGAMVKMEDSSGQIIYMTLGPLKSKHYDNRTLRRTESFIDTLTRLSQPGKVTVVHE